jgi:hypothetical protein
METSTTSATSDMFSDILVSKNNSNWIYILILIALFVFLVYYLTNTAEHMTAGTLTQLYAQDMQDTYLKGNVDQLATGNFLLKYNHPTRVSSGYGYGNGVPNRGQLLSTIPQVSVNPNPITNASPKNMLSVNVPGILSPVLNTPFPRVDPKSTVGNYPDINNILVNQNKENIYVVDEMKNNKRETLRENSLNTLQNSLVNACQYCVAGKCNNCPVCLNGRLKHNKNIIDTKIQDGLTIGNLHDENEYLNVESFSNNDDIVYFVNEVNDGNENLVNQPLRLNTGTCQNCPEGRCINCPVFKCSNLLNCPLGSPCDSCKTDKSNSDQIENFECACRRKVITATNLNKKDIKDIIDDNPTIDNRDIFTSQNIQNIQKNKENFSSVGFEKLCPCSTGNCVNCPLCRNGKCGTCPKITNTFIDLASFGNGHGGYRLGTNWNEATTGPDPINITESIVYYPDSYLGSYFINPTPDIAYPYAVIPKSRTVGGLMVNNDNE